MMPPRPTVLVTHPTPDLYGAARVVLESVEGCVARGWRVVVALPADGPLAGELVARGAEVHLVPSPVLRKTHLSVRGGAALAGLVWRSVPTARRLLRQVRPDVLYANTLTEPLWVLLGRLAGVPVLCHVHEAEASAPRPVRTALALPLLLARRVVANSAFSAAVLAGAVPRLAGRTEVVYNGVPGPTRVVPPRPELGGGVRLLYVGRLSERKGVADAVEVVARLTARGTPAGLDVVGAVYPGYERVEQELRRRVTAAGVADRVRFHGFSADVWGHLARADILLVPSRVDEPFGNTAVEGALAARPVVATTSGGLVEAIAGLGAGVGVPPGDPAAMTSAVEALVGNWARVRQRAIDDAPVTAQRYSTASYQDAITGAVAALLVAPPSS